jgi:hypothetical protein
MLEYSPYFLSRQSCQSGYFGVIGFPVSQPRLTSGGSNERFTSEPPEAGRRNAAWEED